MSGEALDHRYCPRRWLVQVRTEHQRTAALSPVWDSPDTPSTEDDIARLEDRLQIQREAIAFRDQQYDTLRGNTAISTSNFTRPPRPPKRSAPKPRLMIADTCLHRSWASSGAGMARACLMNHLTAVIAPDGDRLNRERASDESSQLSRSESHQPCPSGSARERNGAAGFLTTRGIAMCPTSCGEVCSAGRAAAAAERTPRNRVPISPGWKRHPPHAPRRRPWRRA